MPSSAAAFRWETPFSCRSRLSVREKSVASLSHPSLYFIQEVNYIALYTKSKSPFSAGAIFVSRPFSRQIPADFPEFTGD